MPERVRGGALVAGTALARPGGPGGAEVVEEPLDPPLPDLGDLAPAQLGRDALGVPVRMQPHRDHDLLDPGRVLERRRTRAATLGDERRQAAPRIRRLPAKQTATAALSEREHRVQTLLADEPQQPGTGPHDLASGTRLIQPWRSATTRGEEPETQPFLVGVSKPAALRIAKLMDVACPNVVHATEVASLGCSVPETTGNFN